MRKPRQLVHVSLITLVLFWVHGAACQTVPAVPPPEAVLQGTWDLTPAQDVGLNKTIFVFDQLGRISEMRNVIFTITVSEGDVHQTTEVNGSTVLISTTTNLIFRGTFNEDFTIATGKLTTEFEIPFSSTSISIDQGDATLTKQQ